MYNQNQTFLHGINFEGGCVKPFVNNQSSNNVMKLLDTLHGLKNLKSMVDPEVNPIPSHRIQTPILLSLPCFVLKLELQLQTNLVPPIVDTP